MSTPSELLPVGQYVFQAMTKTNHSFEKLIANLEGLQRVSFFPSSQLADYVNVICRIHSEINLLLFEVVTDRETSNSLYYDRLCSKREKELPFNERRTHFTQNTHEQHCSLSSPAHQEDAGRKPGTIDAGI